MMIMITMDKRIVEGYLDPIKNFIITLILAAFASTCFASESLCCRWDSTSPSKLGDIIIIITGIIITVIIIRIITITISPSKQGDIAN